MKHYRLKVSYDTDPINPRKDYDHLGTLFCWHRSYHLDDESPLKAADPQDTKLNLIAQIDSTFQDRLNATYDNSCSAIGVTGGDFWKAHDQVVDRQARLISAEFDKHYLSLPVYLFDHSGVSLGTSAYSCRWDSGQVGFICLPKKSVPNHFNGTIECAQAAALDCLEVEIGELSMYMGGSVYCLDVESVDFVNVSEGEHAIEELDWEYEASCSGFIGGDVTNNGMLDHVEDRLTDNLKLAMNDVGTWKYTL